MLSDFSSLNTKDASALNTLTGLIPVMALADRIKEAMESAELSPAELARKTNRSAGAVTQWLDGSIKSLKYDTAAALELATGYRAQWLVTGKGEKRVDTTAPEISLRENPDYPSIRFVRFKLSAGASGFGIEYQDGVGAPIVFQRTWFEGRGLDPLKLFATKIANGSMEPGLHDGDTVVVNTGHAKPKDGAVFAVNYEGELVVKRLVRDAGEWWLSSDNPDQRRYPRKLCDESCVIIGEIVHKQSEHI